MSRQHKSKREFVIEENSKQGNVIRRHLDNLVITFGAKAVARLALIALREEIELKLKQEEEEAMSCDS